MNQPELNISLQPLNTFGVAVRSAYLWRFASVEDLIEILKSDLFLQQPHILLGGGSNILFTKDWDGLVLKNEIKGIEILTEDEESALIKIGAGECWHDCVLWAIDHNLGGIENLSLIPGTMGAAPMQNIGAYGVEVKSVIETVEAIDKSTGALKIFSNEACEFGYRESVFKKELKDQYVITHVVIRLSKRHALQLSYGAIQEELTKRNIINPSIKDVSDTVINIRQSKLPDPKIIGNAGSFFKNPIIPVELFEAIKVKFPEMPSYNESAGVKIPAGWLIENAGWKGFQDGDTGVHKKQALVLVNYGGGKGYDIYNLSEKIINDVERRYGIVLQREVNIL